MTKVALLCVLAAGATAAVLELSACSANTGGAGAGAGNIGAGALPGSGGVTGATTGNAGAAAAAASGFGAAKTGGGAAPGDLGGGIMMRPKDMGAGPDGSCGELPFSAEQVVTMKTTTKEIPQPIDLYIMWDQSLSMNCAISNGAGGAGGMGGMAGTAGAAGAGTAATRWDAVKTPLSEWVKTVPAQPPFNVGIGYFGDMLFGSCMPATYEKPDVEIGPLPQNANAIVNSLNAHMPVSNTPTPAALQGAINHATAYKMAHPTDVVVVVLVTDGQPNACGAVADVANVAAMGYNNGMGIKTFVIGVTSPGTTCNVDPNPPNVADLDTVAKAGGTGKALEVDVTQDAAKQLTDELNMIRTSITQTTTKTMVSTSRLQCQFNLPSNINMVNGPNVMFDKSKVNVDLTTNHGMKSDVFRVDSMDQCAGTKALGWYYDNNDMPTKILLCPNACQVVQVPMVDGGVDPTIAGMAPKVGIVLGCKSKYAPPA